MPLLSYNKTVELSLPKYTLLETQNIKKKAMLNDTHHSCASR